MQVDLGLRGKRALVGGASRGLGLAIATALSEEGARVALVARPSDALDDAAHRLDGIAIGADLRDPHAPARAVAEATAALGGLDLLVVNSGGPPAGTFEALEEASWDEAVQGTLMASIRLLREALSALRAGSDSAVLFVL